MLTLRACFNIGRCNIISHQSWLASIASSIGAPHGGEIPCSFGKVPCIDHHAALITESHAWISGWCVMEPHVCACVFQDDGIQGQQSCHYSLDSQKSDRGGSSGHPHKIGDNLHQHGTGLAATGLQNLLPPSVWPYAQLMRIDKPIGTWLLAWPGLWWDRGLFRGVQRQANGCLCSTHWFELNTVLQICW